MGQSHGSTELQRLIDVDAAVVSDGDDLFAVAYQGRVAKLVRDSGQIQWARDLSSFRGLAVDANAVYVSTADGELVRLDRRTGTEQWRQKSLAHRQLSPPVIYRGRVVVADFAGFVHWFDVATGDPIARVLIGKKQRVSTPMIVAGDLLAGIRRQRRAVRTARAAAPDAVTTGCCPWSPSSADPMSASRRCSMR